MAACEGYESQFLLLRYYTKNTHLAGKSSKKRVKKLRCDKTHILKQKGKKIVD